LSELLTFLEEVPELQCSVGYKEKSKAGRMGQNPKDSYKKYDNGKKSI
jgi:hypothetical protein